MDDYDTGYKHGIIEALEMLKEMDKTWSPYDCEYTHVGEFRDALETRLRQEIA